MPITGQVNIQSLHGIIPLQHSDKNIPGLRQRELLADADPRTSIERYEMPCGARGSPILLPTLRNEAVCVLLATDVLAPVEHVRAEVDLCPFRYKDVTLSVRPAAYWEGRVVERAAEVEGYNGV
ncbi:hypothetical protein ACKAV7_006996 [Fusarium commune]